MSFSEVMNPHMKNKEVSTTVQACSSAAGRYSNSFSDPPDVRCRQSVTTLSACQRAAGGKGGAALISLSLRAGCNHAGHLRHAQPVDVSLNSTIQGEQFNLLGRSFSVS